MEKGGCKKCHKKTEKLKINVPIIWVIGGPGSGKGTQCDKIVAKYGFHHISSGDLIRAEVNKKETTPGNTALVSIMGAGQLVSTDYVIDLIRKEINRTISTAKGYLIDGYPRQRDQGILFEKEIASVSMILFFDASTEVLTQRILARGKNSGRVDDNEDTLKSRIATYVNLKDDIIDEYRDKIKIINADGAPDQIFKEVQLYIDTLII